MQPSVEQLLIVPINQQRETLSSPELGRIRGKQRRTFLNKTDVAPTPATAGDNRGTNRKTDQAPGR